MRGFYGFGFIIAKLAKKIEHQADTLPFSQAAYDADNSPKELYLVKGAPHVDMYDNEPFVSEAVIKLSDFFNQNLNKTKF